MIVIRRSLFCVILLNFMLIATVFAKESVTRSQVPAVNARPVVRPVSSPVIPLPMPDLVVSLSCNAKAAGGEKLAVKVMVTNKGRVKAVGTSDGPANKGYVVDLVWSADSVIPEKTAVQAVYQGLTKDDFVEDMLVVGGRISNTKSILPGKSVTYELPAYVPKNMQPGVYWLGAYADSTAHVTEIRENNNTTSVKVLIGAAQDSNTTVPAGVNFWVMPWAVGNTPLYKIKASGLTDYVDGLSGKAMNNAPFGGRLGFRHGYDNRIPTANLHYYRWLYRPASGGSWEEFSETIGAHYVRKVGAAVSHPVYVLGPKNIGGKNLYEFRPHNPPSEAGAITNWPATDWREPTSSNWRYSTVPAIKCCQGREPSVSFPPPAPRRTARCTRRRRHPSLMAGMSSRCILTTGAAERLSTPPFWVADRQPTPAVSCFTIRP
jgi:hypothetical protein